MHSWFSYTLSMIFKRNVYFLQFPHFLCLYIFAIQKMKKRGISLHICVWWFFAKLKAQCTDPTSIQKVTLIKCILTCLHLLYTKNRKKKDYEQYHVSKEYFLLNKLIFKVLLKLTSLTIYTFWKTKIDQTLNTEQVIYQ